MRSRFLALGLLLLIGTLLISAGGCFNSGADSGRIGFDVGEGDEKLIIYSGRKIKLFQPVIEAFNRETGIAVQLLVAGHRLILAPSPRLGLETRASCRPARGE